MREIKLIIKVFFHQKTNQKLRHLIASLVIVANLQERNDINALKILQIKGDEHFFQFIL